MLSSISSAQNLGAAFLLSQNSLSKLGRFTFQFAFCCLLFFAKSAPPAAKACTPQQIPIDCTFQFIPDATWTYYFHDCQPELTLEDCVPIAAQMQCNPGDGEFEVGVVIVTIGNETFHYSLKCLSGVVEIDLMDEF